MIGSLSLLVNVEEGKEEYDEEAVRTLSEMDDFVRRVRVLYVGNNK